MDFPLAPTALDLSRRRRKFILLLAAVGFSGYCSYKIYRLPLVTRKRKKLAKLFRALVSIAEAISSFADTVALVSSDLNRFLRADSDEIPTSLRQMSKITRSDEFAGSLSKVSKALTIGVRRGIQSGSSPESDLWTAASFSDSLLDKLFSTAGTSFASVVVGSFARGLVMAFYSANAQSSTIEMPGQIPPVSDSQAVPAGWMHVICGDKCRQLIGDWIQVFVSTAVAVHLQRTMHINTYDQLFSGLTNPKYEPKVKDILVSVCNGAVETLVNNTSHQVLANPNSSSLLPREGDIERDEEEGLPPKKHAGKSSPDGRMKDVGGWVDRVATTLAVPANRRLVLDVTGRVTFETVKSFLEFVLWKLFDNARRGVDIVSGEIIGRGLVIVRHITAKSMVIVTGCLALCLDVLAGTRVLLPA